jgi:molybdopterin synthase catalytic subunit
VPVRVQTEDFDAGSEIAALRRGDPTVGAVASFIGLVRDVNDSETVSEMTLEHYPGMTERALERIVAHLQPLDQIVLVAVTGAHRGEAFAACEFVMDYLKTQAPFWKKERTPAGARWVEARAADDRAAERWTEPKR